MTITFCRSRSLSRECAALCVRSCAFVCVSVTITEKHRSRR